MSILFSGLQKSVAFMTRRVRTGTILAALLVPFVVASCGEPAGPGLGSVLVNDGSEVEYSHDFVGDPCVASGIVWTAVGAYKTDADMGSVVFGSDTILDIQPPPPSTELVTDASLVVFANPAWRIQHSNSPEAAFFVNPNLVLDTTDGIGTINTGDSGVSYIVADYSFLMSPDEVVNLFLDFFPIFGGDDYAINVAVTCSAP